MGVQASFLQYTTKIGGNYRTMLLCRWPDEAEALEQKPRLQYEVRGLRRCGM